MDKLTAREYEAIDGAFGSSGIAGAELLIQLRAARPDQRDLFTSPGSTAAKYGRDPFASTSRIGPIFTAGYTSECGECGCDIEEGDRARMIDGEAVHVDCVDPDGGSISSTRSDPFTRPGREDDGTSYADGIPS
jgi:hypothetical protein